MKVASETLGAVVVGDFATKQKQKLGRQARQNSFDEKAAGCSVSSLVQIFQQETVNKVTKFGKSNQVTTDLAKDTTSNCGHSVTKKQFLSLFEQLDKRLKDAGDDQTLPTDRTFISAANGKSVAVSTAASASGSTVEPVMPRENFRLGAAESNLLTGVFSAHQSNVSLSNSQANDTSGFSSQTPMTVENSMNLRSIFTLNNFKRDEIGSQVVAKASDFHRNETNDPSVIKGGHKFVRHAVISVAEDTKRDAFNIENEAKADLPNQLSNENALQQQHSWLGPPVVASQHPLRQGVGPSVPTQITDVVSRALAQPEFIDPSAGVEKNLSIRLQTEGLGQIDITLISKDGKLNVHLSAEREDTLRAIQLDSDQLKTAISMGDKKFDQIDLSFAISNEKGSDQQIEHQAGADGFSGHYTQANAGGSKNEKENTKSSQHSESQQLPDRAPPHAIFENIDRRFKRPLSGSIYL